MSRVCSNCGGSDIDIDQARGDAVCMNCGSVLEDNIIVSEVQFQENSIGGSSAIGQFVSSEGNKTGIAPGFRHGLGKESRAVTLENGKRRINHVGHQLQMNQHCIDTAYNFYKLAVNKRLTRGRRTNHVVAACLYLVCRTERTPHMLLDFSDILNIDVFTLGRAYMKLAQELYINLPALDPCLYIHRFAHKLEFGDKEHDVAMTALRLVSRMKRDWIHHGRRPSGLCGAAILVAARLHSFSRTVREVVKVVRISDTTIRKRLGEFKDTPSSQLTVDEFQKIDLEEEQDPPSFTQAKKRIKQQTEDLNNPAIANELEHFQEEIENLLQKSTESTAEIHDAPSREKQLLSTDSGELMATSPSPHVAPPSTVENQVAESTDHGAQPLTGAKKDADKGESGDADESKGEELDLSGLDDDELDKCLLTENEVEIKTKLWMDENKDYLEMLKEKEAKEAREREEGVNKEPKKKRKPYKKKQNLPASTAGEAIEKMLVEKKISSKINYEVLRGLETSEAPKPAEFASVPAAAAAVPETKTEHEFLIPRVPTRRGGRKRESPASAAPSQSLPGAKKRKEEDEVVIESGPVEYEKDDDPSAPEHAHTEGDTEDEDDELQHVSAAQLMGHMYNEGPEDEYGDFEEDF